MTTKHLILTNLTKGLLTMIPASLCSHIYCILIHDFFFPAPTSNLDEFLDDYDSDGTNCCHYGFEYEPGYKGVPVTFI
jgi:hypothetical protein